MNIDLGRFLLIENITQTKPRVALGRVRKSIGSELYRTPSPYYTSKTNDNNEVYLCRNSGSASIGPFYESELFPILLRPRTHITGILINEEKSNLIGSQMEAYGLYWFALGSIIGDINAPIEKSTRKLVYRLYMALS